MSRQRYRSAEERFRRELQRNLLARPGRHAFILVLDGLKAGFNVAKILRSAEIFGAREVHLVNIGPFDPAPAKGALRKVPVRRFDSFAESHAELRAAGYRLFVLESGKRTSLCEAVLPEKTAFVLGHEEFGPSPACRARDDLAGLSIPQFGETESLNVSVAAGIVMYEYVRQWKSSSTE
ncbi:TrmH family RNA methyltransferase [Geothermobacter hydrogeniphilus]|uniref:TrmH family RNA methyltransferase n=1 Tax=Geothermobacter hydrogeniphilus TaxID=1969733 RepID=A0A2K2HEK1_9BACT|nr:TrmH family RNA methyltransferase [Geothermobacter hydrogeniphilus]PNU21718.1 TrmH family RNA methyltransferase [Geothermobacter hydrogeniphilus]